ncbi:MAG: family 20 glycosylhydrolase [Bacteroidales bacterium]|nr:family 20 glycosylhydrolase [Bacteroidales bacterium]
MTILFSLLLLITTVTGGSTPDCIIPKVASYTTATGKSAGSITLDKEKDFALSDADLAAIKFKIGPKELKGKPDGAYTLIINKKGISVSAAGEAGKFYALQSLIQMRNADPEGRVAFCRIDDAPRFRHRGLMFDLVRHFQSKDFILKQIDAMALVKMSRLQLHLTDNEAWRVKLDCAPEMASVAAFGDAWFFHNFLSGKAQKYGSEPAGYVHGTVYDDGHVYGGYLTKDDLREIVAYAAERQIEVIPEIELPGHNRVLLSVHPEYYCDGKHPANNVICAGREDVFAFFEKVLEEVMEIFPSKYIHIGGDEASKANWVLCSRCKQRMAAEGLKDEFELQSYIIRRAEKFINAHGKRLIGWDEILEGGLSENATVMSWRGVAGGIKANSMGHDVIMTPNTYYYLDYGQDAPYKEPMAFRPYLAIESVYNYDPEEGISSLEHLLGVQGNLWGECVLEPWHFEYMLYPRAFAVAETGWSPAGSKDYASFRERAIALGKWLKDRDYTLFNLETEVGDRPEAAVEIPRITQKAKAGISIDNGASRDASILVDGRLGGWNVADRKVWNEVRGKSVTIDIDLGEKYNISYLGAEFADYNLRRIRMPEDVQFSVSSDGKNYTPVSVPQPRLHPERTHFQIITVGGTVELKAVKYVRLTYNTGKRKVTVDISEVIINGRPRNENREKDWANFSRYSEDNKKVKNRPVAVLFGDSITQNWAKFDNQWLRDHGFIGRGISGQTTSEMLVRFRSDVIELQPEYVAILAGINDIAHNNGIIKVENIFKNLVSMVELAKLHGIKPIMCTLVPAKEIGWYKQVGDPRPAIDSLNTLIRSYALANGIPLADYHTALKTEDGALRPEYAGDAVHPNVAGTKVMEEVLLKLMDN